MATVIRVTPAQRDAARLIISRAAKTGRQVRPAVRAIAEAQPAPAGGAPGRPQLA